MKRHIILATGASLALLGFHRTARAQVTAFLENPARLGRGSLAIFDETTGGLTELPAQLQDLRFLDIEFNGRTPLTEMDPNTAHLREDVPGAARISLPHDLGCLYRYERKASGGTFFGFLHIDSTGAYQLLAERLVPKQKDPLDPHYARIALSPDCMSFLVATKLRAGGDLLEVNLVTGRVFDRTRSWAPQQFKLKSLRLGDTWGLAVTSRRVLRFARGITSQTHVLPFPSPTPTYFSDTVALSSNTDWALVIAGDNGSAAYTYSLGATGMATRVSQQPARISRGGSLPQHVNGPYLAISDDGLLAAWRQEMTDVTGQPTSELFLARVPLGTPSAAEQLSSDARYLDTLDEIGLLSFIGPRTLSYVVGEKEPGPDGLGVTSADLFTATMPTGPGAPQLLNLSQTNGQVGPPFTLAPEMKPTKMAWLASEQRFLLFDDGDAEAVVTVDAMLGGTQVVLDEVKDVGLFELTTSGFLFDARRTNNAGGNWDLMRHSGNLNSPPTLVQSSPTDNASARGAPRADGLVSFVGAPTGTMKLSRVDVSTGSMQALTGFAQYGAVIGYSPGGSLSFSAVDGLGQTELNLWKANGTVTTLATPPGAKGFVLPTR